MSHLIGDAYSRKTVWARRRRTSRRLPVARPATVERQASERARGAVRVRTRDDLAVKHRESEAKRERDRELTQSKILARSVSECWRRSHCRRRLRIVECATRSRITRTQKAAVCVCARTRSQARRVTGCARAPVHTFVCRATRSCARCTTRTHTHTRTSYETAGPSVYEANETRFSRITIAPLINSSRSQLVRARAAAKLSKIRKKKARARL